jgi:hypothetical protein
MSEHRKTYQDANGVRRTLIWDDETPDEVTVHAEQNLDEILPGIERDRVLLNQRGPNKHLARIPAAHADRVLRMDDDELKAYLNSSDAAPYRIWEGRV